MGLRDVLGRLRPRSAPAPARPAHGAYELRVELLHAGTRSEGRIGRLYRGGVEVRDGVAGEVVEADGRRFTFLGDERPHLWSTSGWTEEPVGDEEP
ncbi:MAG: hypothetical protein KF703_19585 [Actinobacteria bacterium]|nr:hypothetical protein [Actinomycetota bacterium]